MARVGLLIHGGRADAHALGVQVAAWLHQRGHDVVASDQDASLLTGAEQELDDGSPPLDLVLAIGGDGTVLRAARRAVHDDAAILGINLGQLGYLAEIEAGAWEPALERFLAGAYRIEERLMVSAAMSPDGPASLALNEVVVEKQSTGHTVRLGITIDGEFFTSYVADGVILASPTGSTAYSLSARGPIVAPSHKALLLTPVSPHTLFDRSLVLSPTSVVEVSVMGQRDAVLSVDGQPREIVTAGASVTVRAAERPAKFATFGGPDFHQILKAKFGLSDR